MQSIPEHSTTAKDQKILEIPLTNSNEKADIFQDNFEHLQALEYEARLWLAIAYLKRGKSAVQGGQANVQKGPDLSFSGVTPDRLTPANLKKLLLKVEADNRIKAYNSIKKGITLHFEKFCESYHLDNFERVVVMLLLANSTCMDVRKLYNESHFKETMSKKGEMTIGSLLYIICDDYRKQLLNRQYFSTRGTLFEERIIPRYCLFNTANILDLEVYLHDEVVNHILGDNNIYDTCLKYINKEKCVVKLDTIIISEEIKKDVVNLAKNYLKQKERKEKLSLKQFYGYGTGLVFLFHGPSGTGKTMFAHALAHTMGKDILSMSYETAIEQAGSLDVAIRYLFKEAAITNSIVFFDECDGLIRKHTPENGQFLIEIEKAECITILATNRVVDLDPSLDRRITMKVPFDIPDEIQREKIWNSLVPTNISLDKDVNFKELSKKYIFTGGLIKNTLFMAINNAAKKNDSSNIIITPDEIKKAAAYQSESMFKKSSFGKIYKPRMQIDDLSLKAQNKKELRKLAAIIERLSGRSMGINVVIGASDIETGIDCVEAVASLCECKVRRFDLIVTACAAESAKVKDPFTQQEISIIDYVFSINMGDQPIIMFVDYGSFFERILSNSPEELEKELFDFWSKLRTFDGIIFLVTTPIKKHLIPIEFHHYIEVNYPTEELQIRRWESHLKNGDFPEDKIIALVERHPMHLHEIDHMARQSTIASFLNGHDGDFALEDLHEAIGRLKYKKGTLTLFGEDR